MKKLFTLLAAASLLFASCTAEDATPVVDNVIPDEPSPKSYLFMPCNGNPFILNIPEVPAASVKLQIKRASGGDWIEYPLNAYNRVQNNDSVWFQITDPEKYIPNENNYLAYQVFNKDTIKSSNQNHYVKFETYNACINSKLRVKFQEYY